MTESIEKDQSGHSVKLRTVFLKRLQDCYFKIVDGLVGNIMDMSEVEKELAEQNKQNTLLRCFKVIK